MSHEELSRVIANYFEPFTNLPQIDEENDQSEERLGVRFWDIRSIHQYDQHWEPRSVVTDPAMTMLLLRELILMRYDLLFSWERESECSGDYPYIDFMGKHVLRISKDLSDFGKVVAEAFAKAKKLI